MEEKLDLLTDQYIDAFAHALKAKAFAAQKKYGYTENWAWDDYKESDCRTQFFEHIAKGDPKDVALYCMFMWYHNWSTIR